MINSYKLSLSFKNQIKHLFQRLCYVAFGNKINTTIQSIGQSQYRIHIANDLYKHYQAQGFKYSTDGVTPKGIAQDIEVHLKNVKNFSHQIDEFGVFNIKVSEYYYENMFGQINTHSRFLYSPLHECQIVNFKPKPTNILYLVQPKIKMRDYRIIHHLESIAQTKEHLEETKVQRIILKHSNPLQAITISYQLQNNLYPTIQPTEQNLQNYLKAKNILTKQQVFKYAIKISKQKSINKVIEQQQLQSINFIKQHLIKQNVIIKKLSEYRPVKVNRQQISMIGCEREQLVKYQRYWPYHQIVSVGNIQPNNSVSNSFNPNIHMLFARNKPKDAISITKQGLKEHLEKQNQKIQKYQNWSLGEKIIQFGDSLNQYNFEQAFNVMMSIKQANSKSKQMLLNLKKTYLKIVCGN